MARGTVLVFHTFRCWQWYAGNIGVPGETNGAATLGLVFRDQALGVLGTWVLVQAGVDTVLAPAGLVQGTLLVAAATNDLAGDEGISFIACDTLAHGAVLGWVALSEPSTGVLDQAGVDTVAVDAGLLVAALVISLATRQLTGNLRVANVARRTDTDWPVILDEAGSS